MRAAYIMLLVIAILVFAATTPTNAFSKPEEKYTYFFVVPQGMKAHLVIVGINETTYRIYNLSELGFEKTLFTEDRISRMQMQIHGNFTAGCYLIESGSRLAVAVAYGSLWRRMGGYYPATTGGYLGKEFIFAVFPTGDVPYTVLAYEDAKITVYDSEGKKVQELQVWQNETGQLSLIPQNVYRVVSTGRIAIMAATQPMGCFVIDPMNRFRGRFFMFVTYSHALLIPYEPCKVEVLDKKGSKLKEYTFTEEDVMKNNIILHFHAYIGAHIVKSTGDVTVMLSALTGLSFPLEKIQDIQGCQLAYVQPNMEFKFYALSEAYIYTPYESSIEIDGVATPMSPGQYIRLEGDHVYTVKSNKPFIVYTYNVHSIDTIYLVAGEDAGNTLPPPKPSQKHRGGGGLPIPMEALAGIAVVMVIAAIIALRKKK